MWDNLWLTSVHFASRRNLIYFKAPLCLGIVKGPGSLGQYSWKVHPVGHHLTPSPLLPSLFIYECFRTIYPVLQSNEKEYLSMLYIVQLYLWLPRRCALPRHCWCVHVDYWNLRCVYICSVNVCHGAFTVAANIRLVIFALFTFISNNHCIYSFDQSRPSCSSSVVWNNISLSSLNLICVSST